jgi:hypothetical protein
MLTAINIDTASNVMKTRPLAHSALPLEFPGSYHLLAIGAKITRSNGVEDEKTFQAESSLCACMPPSDGNGSIFRQGQDYLDSNAVRVHVGLLLASHV